MNALFDFFQINTGLTTYNLFNYAGLILFAIETSDRMFLLPEDSSLLLGVNKSEKNLLVIFLLTISWPFSMSLLFCLN